MKTPIERFQNKYQVNENGCWLWSASKDKNTGYGQFSYLGKCMLAHRASWILFKEEIPKGLWVLHKCDIPACVNPEHLFLGTRQDNSDDMVSKGRQYWGMRTHCSNGHEYKVSGFYIGSKGQRECKPCHNKRTTECRRRKRAKCEPVPKTHCSNGHKLTLENVYMDNRGVKGCRLCRRDRNRRWREKKKRGEL